MTGAFRPRTLRDQKIFREAEILTLRLAGKVLDTVAIAMAGKRSTVTIELPPTPKQWPSKGKVKS